MKTIVFLFLSFFALSAMAQKPEATQEQRAALKKRTDSLHQIGRYQNQYDSINTAQANAYAQTLTKKYGKATGKRLASELIQKGDTKQMVEDSWGTADKITPKAWYYKAEKTYVVFVNGKVSEIY